MPTTYVDNNAVIGWSGNIGLVLWRRETSVEVVERLGEGLVDLARHHERVGIYAQIDEGASMLSAEARAEFEQVARELGPRLHACSTVCLGSGFLPAVVRGVLTAVSLVQPFKSKAFAETTPACDWLAGELRYDPYKLKLAHSELMRSAPTSVRPSRPPALAGSGSSR